MRARLLILLSVFAISLEISAGPGDTTWVTVFSGLKLDHHGNYDTTALFPTGKRYRKIRMHYILGRYACPGNPQYCGSWDYTTQIFALPKAKDTVEIGRVITPYATDWLSKNKSHDYVLEVTDYSSVLNDSTHIRFRYDGYSWGFTLTLKFELIEGVPPMDAKSVKNLYDGYFAYGNSANPIENHLVPAALSYTTARAALRNTITGHGADATGCSEFCSKYYNLLINNFQVSQKQLWRDDCGYNEVYPQTGTWVFDRGNWCPGAVVWPIYHFLEASTAPSATFTADIDMQPYTIASPSGGYNIVSQLISYSDYNFFSDASIEDIIAPTKDANFARSNPACGSPVIRVKNTGSGTISSLAFEYGLTGLMLSTYSWTGEIKPLETADIVFPANQAVMAHSVSAQFEAHIVKVNGIADENSDNNSYYSMTTPVKQAADDLVIEMGTNKSAAGGLSETSWKLYNALDSVVAQRMNAAPNKIYQDTIMDLPPGCYKLVVNDAGCDGFDWWYYQYYSVNPGTGNMRIDKLGQNNPIFLFAGDFGCGFTRYFHVGDYPAPPPLPNLPGFKEFETRNHVNVYPNPANGSVILAVMLAHKSSVTYKITDISGRTVSKMALGDLTMSYETIDCSAFSPGVYFVEVNIGGVHSVSRKLIVQ